MKRAILCVASALCVVCVDARAFLAAAAQSPQSQAPSTSRPGEVVPPRRTAPTSRTGDQTKGTGSIHGRITLSTGRPARKASIQLSSNGPAHATAADDNGNYEFTELPPDTYYVSAGRPGFLVLEYGQKRAFERGDGIELGDGESRTKVDITLVPAGAVSGRVVDENGDPVERATVRLLQLQYISNRRQLVDIPQAGGRSTDDTGAYRIYGVPPGDYIVRASVTDRLPGTATAFGVPIESEAADLPGYAPTYFPGGVDPAGAQIVRVGLSQDLQGIDFALSPVATARVTGRATDARGQPVGVLLARSQRSSGYAERPVRAVSTADGGFRFDNVAPGEYILQTAGGRRGPNGEADFASTYLKVDGKSISDVTLQGAAGSQVSGRVVVEGATGGSRMPPIQITAWPADFDLAPLLLDDIARTRVGDDGRFSLDGLHGPRRIRLAQGPGSWQLKSVRANGLDVTDEALSFGLPRDSLSNVEIVITEQGPTLAGKAVDDQGRDSHDYAVVAFSTDPDRWYQRSRFLATARGRQDGSFSIASLAPGEYYVAAVSSLLNAEGWGEWQDPDFLKKLSASATKVTLAESQNAGVSLRVLAR